MKKSNSNIILLLDLRYDRIQAIPLPPIPNPAVPNHWILVGHCRYIFPAGIFSDLRATIVVGTATTRELSVTVFPASDSMCWRLVLLKIEANDQLAIGEMRHQ